VRRELARVGLRIGDKTRRDASSRATKAFYPALSMCDLIFSGVFECHSSVFSIPRSAAVLALLSESRRRLVAFQSGPRRRSVRLPR